MSNVISDSVGSLAGWWTNTFGEGAGATAKGQALDAQLAAINQRDYAPGGVIYQQIEDTQGTAAADAAYAADQTNLATQQSDTATFKDQVTAAAQQGAADGLNKGKSAVNGFFESLFGVIPASVWIITAVGLFLYFGGWQWLTRKARKSLSK
ncbi:MAG: hypothetical protein WCS94_08285 [Verrucomicrobiota bacterium]